LGAGVICNVQNLNNLFDNAQKLLQKHSGVVVEEFYGGLKSYRILVFKNKILAITTRNPAMVIGDGINNIMTLIRMENKKKIELIGIEKQMLINEEIEYCLGEQGLTLNNVPKSGRKIFVCHTVNVARGGTIDNQPVTICRENKNIALKVAQILNLQLAGIDVACEDLNKPIDGVSGIIIEANFNPNIIMHENNIDIVESTVAYKIMRHFIFKHPLHYLNSQFKKNKNLRSYTRMLISIAAVIVLTAYYIKP